MQTTQRPTDSHAGSAVARKPLHWLALVLAITLTTTMLTPGFRTSPTDAPVTANANAYLIKTGSPTLLKRVLSLTGIELKVTRRLSGQSVLATLASHQPGRAIGGILDLLTTARLIDYAEPDDLVVPVTLPADDSTDSFFSLQWQLGDSHSAAAAINLQDAWRHSEGSPATTIAVIDSGVRFEHPDLTGRLLPGYDFVSDLMQANDGDARDADPSDPGDGVDPATSDYYTSQGRDCESKPSSWHGTAVASLIAGNGNLTNGITGVDLHANVLPVRAIGQCGGRRSDFHDALRWAAGVSDPSLPVNPTPARIINLSINVAGYCTTADQHAIDDAIRAGAIIVTGAGNSAADLGSFPTSPSTCENVISVAAVNSAAARAIYSNYGRQINIAAPGGESAAGDGRKILAASNAGQQHAVAGNYYRRYAGTSVAAPLVSGVLGLMIGANSALTNDQLVELLLSTTRDFPQYGGATDCTTNTCGTGLLDAAAAISASTNYSAFLSDNPTASISRNADATDSSGVGSMGLLIFSLPLVMMLLVTRRKPGIVVPQPLEEIGVAVGGDVGRS